MATTTISTTAMMISAIGTTRSYNTLDGTRGVCFRPEVAGVFGSSDWLIRTLAAVSLACTLYDRQAICQTAFSLIREKGEVSMRLDVLRNRLRGQVIAGLIPVRIGVVV